MELCMSGELPAGFISSTRAISGGSVLCPPRVVAGCAEVFFFNVLLFSPLYHMQTFEIWRYDTCSSRGRMCVFDLVLGVY